MIQGAYLKLGRWWSIPIRIHLAAPLGIFVLGHFRFIPGYWVGSLLLILFHELGHAYFVRKYGQRVVGVDLNIIGGVCRWQGEVTQVKRIMIAWGGVLAQGVVLAGTDIANRSFGPFHSPFMQELLWTWTAGNVYLIALNLLPIPPLDGATAWQAVPILKRRIERRIDALRRERHSMEVERLAADLARNRLSPDLKAQLDQIVEEARVGAPTER